MQVPLSLSLFCKYRSRVLQKKQLGSAKQCTIEYEQGTCCYLNLNLTIRYSTASFDTVDVCDSYLWNNVTYTESGDYIKHFTNAAGCDSTANLNLTIRYSSSSDETMDVCDSYSWNNITYTQSGDYSKQFTNAAGCDSTANLHLTIRYSSLSRDTVNVCDSYDWNGSTYTQSGV